MSSSMLIRKHKFLIDENVRVELLEFLKTSGFDVKVASKGSSDKDIASMSLGERRVLVTNDRDFTEYPKKAIFSVVWLRIPQNDPKSLIVNLKKTLNECRSFEGKIIVLEQNKWKEYPLEEIVEA